MAPLASTLNNTLRGSALVGLALESLANILTLGQLEQLANILQPSQFCEFSFNMLDELAPQIFSPDHDEDSTFHSSQAQYLAASSSSHSRRTNSSAPFLSRSTKRGKIISSNSSGGVLSGRVGKSSPVNFHRRRREQLLKNQKLEEEEEEDKVPMPASPSTGFLEDFLGTEDFEELQKVPEEVLREMFN